MLSTLRVPNRPIARLLVAGALIAVLASCRPMSSSEVNLFVATNDLREANGLPALAQQETLLDEARAWAKALAAQGALAHSDPTQWNVAWTSVAENVGVSTSMDDLVQRLEASPDHRQNMLSTKYTHQAVGTALGKDGRIYAVQMFWRG